MKRLTFFCLLFSAFLFCAFAGDCANFADIGFSEDGSVYCFGQYGITDSDFQSYAEIYAVDVKNNSFLPNGIFRTMPSSQTANLSGKECYQKLKEKSSYFINRYSPKSTEVDNILYIRGASKTKPEDIIKVKDFENSTKDNPVYYTFQLVPHYEGKGENSTGAFFVSIEKQDADGKVLSRKTVGNADRKRPGVTGYSIEKIITDKTGKNFIIIVEKKVADKTGISIRYMVETFTF
jgi:predicted secreted protein